MCAFLVGVAVSSCAPYEPTKRGADVGKFKAPSLRNIALTGPYMHDGSIATLEEAVEHYAARGRSIASGPFAGKGAGSPNKGLNEQNNADPSKQVGSCRVSAVVDGLRCDPRRPVL